MCASGVASAVSELRMPIWGIWCAVVVGGAATSMVLTKLVRSAAIRRGLLDTPNQRSSHTIPTPRGGGLAIVVVYLLGLFALFAAQVIPLETLMALAAGSSLIATISFIDDHGHVPSIVRLGVQLGSAALVLWLLGVPSHLGFGAIFGWVACGVLAVGTAWFTNLYNFMDGIDGIAASQAVCIGVAGAAVCLLSGAVPLAIGSALLAAASAGFLVYNWPPAKIFMGDVGSATLGFSFAALAMAGWVTAEIPLQVWLILGGYFISDASVTLARRALRGDNVLQAHRMHAYQHAAAKYGHLLVTSCVIVVNVCWLWPLAALALLNPGYSLPLVILAYIPLLAAVLYLRAGLPTAAGDPKVRGLAS